MLPLFPFKIGKEFYTQPQPVWPVPESSQVAVKQVKSDILLITLQILLWFIFNRPGIAQCQGWSGATLQSLPTHILRGKMEIRHLQQQPPLHLFSCLPTPLPQPSLPTPCTTLIWDVATHMLEGSQVQIPYPTPPKLPLTRDPTQGSTSQQSFLPPSSTLDRRVVLWRPTEPDGAGY